MCHVAREDGRAGAAMEPSFPHALPDVLVERILGTLPLAELANCVCVNRALRAAAPGVAATLASRLQLTIEQPVEGEGWITALATAQARAYGGQRRRTVAAGVSHTLWIVDGRVQSSGNDPMNIGDLSHLGKDVDESLLGPVAPGVLMQPVRALSAVEIVEVAAGTLHSLALTKSGLVFAFGRNTHGQLGEAPAQLTPGGVSSGQTMMPGRAPMVIRALEHVTARRVSCGAFYSLVIDALGRLYSFGSNEYGELCCSSSILPGNERRNGIPDGCCALPSRAASGLPQLQQAACGRAHTLLLTLGGRVYACGRNVHGQLGVHTESTANPQRVDVPSQSLIAQVACGDNHSIAVTEDGEVFGWGCDDGGQLSNSGGVCGPESHWGNNVKVPRSIGVPNARIASTSGMRHIVRASAGKFHTLLLASDGSVYMLGTGCPRPAYTIQPGNGLGAQDIASMPVAGPHVYIAPMGLWLSPPWQEAMEVLVSVHAVESMMPTEICAGARHSIVTLYGTVPTFAFSLASLGWGAAERCQCGFEWAPEDYLDEAIVEQIAASTIQVQLTPRVVAL